MFGHISSYDKNRLKQVCERCQDIVWLGIDLGTLYVGCRFGTSSWVMSMCAFDLSMLNMPVAFVNESDSYRCYNKIMENGIWKE